MKNSGSQTLPLTKKEFLDSVLRIGPKVAAFDCDGTLWSGDAGERFFDWEINHGIVPAEVGRAMRARYLEYKAGKVPDVDYQQLKASLQDEAATLLAEIARLEAKPVDPRKPKS